MWDEDTERIHLICTPLSWFARINLYLVCSKGQGYSFCRLSIDGFRQLYGVGRSKLNNSQFLSSFTLTSFPVKVFEDDGEKKKTSLQKRKRN